MNSTKKFVSFAERRKRYRVSPISLPSKSGLHSLDTLALHAKRWKVELENTRQYPEIQSLMNLCGTLDTLECAISDFIDVYTLLYTAEDVVIEEDDGNLPHDGLLSPVVSSDSLEEDPDLTSQLEEQELSEERSEDPSLEFSVYSNLPLPWDTAASHQTELHKFASYATMTQKDQKVFEVVQVCPNCETSVEVKPKCESVFPVGECKCNTCMTYEAPSRKMKPIEAFCFSCCEKLLTERYHCFLCARNYPREKGYLIEMFVGMENNGTPFIFCASCIEPANTKFDPFNPFCRDCNHNSHRVRVSQQDWKDGFVCETCSC
jgi:hypothetical protein